MGAHASVWKLVGRLMKRPERREGFAAFDYIGIEAAKAFSRELGPECWRAVSKC